ncbi:type 2 phosphatidic acid phosphatase [Niveomyces insectorum RCEF 264]|uniref:Type 2 phosphatidic acid phosphatase n=1 Tax=Niveomyces insectorum RCEF 264 TaxID=1081102 RepID=A0A167S2J1_9HYPO|nr:type 2 phosphatidic acid phosphatase [Niveomyces insectorum RCEF 264]
MAFLWPAAAALSHWNPIPRKYLPGRSRRKPKKPRLSTSIPSSRAFASPIASGNSDKISPNGVAALQRSFNPTHGVRSLRRHRWSIYDLQHLVTVSFVLFSFTIAPIPLVVDFAVLLGYALLLLMPVTRQFFLPSLPIWTYLFYFFSSRFIPIEYRPHIWVKVLPALENVLYGANLSNILSAHTHPVLDLLAWIPYGLGHFGAPAICSALMFLFAAPGTTPVFARAFGYLALIGVTTQLVFPCTPPWYERTHGLEPAHYGMPGSPAGLARVDQLLGVDMYTTSFTTAPLPFGAFPSLHAADATLEALFMSYCFPRFRIIFVAYVGWIWWATMYLNHHYAVDLVAGSLLAALFYYVARASFMPRRQLDKRHRWEYEYVELGEKNRSVVDEYAYAYYDGFGLDLLPRHHSPNGGFGDSDEWTLGSTSSFASSSGGSTSGSIAGTGSRGNSSPGTMSPTTPEVEFHPVSVLGWDGHNATHNNVLSEVVVAR